MLTIRISSLPSMALTLCCDAVVGVSAGGGPLEVLYLGLCRSLES